MSREELAAGITAALDEYVAAREEAERRARWRPYSEAAGWRESRRVRQTGTVVSIYRTEEMGLDPAGGAWLTVCEEHSANVGHRTLALARCHMSDPRGWCEQCREAAR